MSKDLSEKINKKEKKLKILSAVDFHGDTAAIAKLAKQAETENVDLVILCGDLLNFDQPVDNIIGPFKEVNKKVLFIPGNHDSFATADFLAEVYGIKNIHGYSVKYEDVGIFGCGGAPCGPVTQVTDKEMLDLLKQGYDQIKYLKKKIMVTHVHPSDSDMDKLGIFVKGSKAVKEAIDKFKPDIVFCGHAHEAQGIEEKIGDTLVINPGKSGKIIEL